MFNWHTRQIVVYGNPRCSTVACFLQRQSCTSISVSKPSAGKLISHNIVIEPCRMSHQPVKRVPRNYSVTTNVIGFDMLNHKCVWSVSW